MWHDDDTMLQFATIIIPLARTSHSSSTWSVYVYVSDLNANQN